MLKIDKKTKNNFVSMPTYSLATTRTHYMHVYTDTYIYTKITNNADKPKNEVTVYVNF